MAISRRHFFFGSVLAGAVPSAGFGTIASLTRLGYKSPNEKLNIAALGNVVPQLHVHIIARRSNDAAWPRPVWGVVPPLAHDAEEVQRLISALRRKIWLG